MQENKCNGEANSNKIEQKRLIILFYCCMKLFFRERFLKAMNKSITEKTSRLCATKYIFSIAPCFFFYDNIRIFFSPVQAKNH